MKGSGHTCVMYMGVVRLPGVLSRLGHDLGCQGERNIGPAQICRLTYFQARVRHLACEAVRRFFDVAVEIYLARCAGMLGHPSNVQWLNQLGTGPLICLGRRSHAASCSVATVDNLALRHELHGLLSRQLSRQLLRRTLHRNSVLRLLQKITTTYVTNASTITLYMALSKQARQCRARQCRR